MTKQEISEIKKLLTPKNCSITRICGCYVDGEKNKKALFGQAFLALPEEEMFKYFEILRKALSGTLGKGRSGQGNARCRKRPGKRPDACPGVRRWKRPGRRCPERPRTPAEAPGQQA